MQAEPAGYTIRGDKTLAELAAHFQVHPNQITLWKGQLLERNTLLHLRWPFLGARRLRDLLNTEGSRFKAPLRHSPTTAVSI